MRDAQDLEDEANSVPYQKSRMSQAIDNVKAAHETSRGGPAPPADQPAARP